MHVHDFLCWYISEWFNIHWNSMFILINIIHYIHNIEK